MPIAVGVMADSYNKPAAGGGWTPADLGVKLKIWLDASDPATITASGGAVSEWRDKSGGGIHFAQTTGTSTTGTRTINGRNTIDFPGLAGGISQMTGATFVQAQPFTVAFVALTDVDTSTTVRLIGRGNTTTVNIGRTGTSGLVNCGGTNALQLSAWETTVAHRQVALINGATTEVRVDGASTTGSTGTTGFSGAPLLGAITVAAGAWDGPVGEIVVASGVLAGGDLTNLETYLKTKWGTP